MADASPAVAATPTPAVVVAVAADNTATQAHFTTGDPNKEQYTIQIKRMDLESGWLGKFFGAGDKAAMNIAGIAIILSFTVGIAVAFKEGGAASGETWKYVAPIITGALGFTFGKRT